MLVLALLLLLAAVALAVRLAPFVSEFRRVRRMTANIPGPPGYPLFGIAIEFGLLKPHERYYKAQKWVASYAPVARISVGHLTGIFVSEPEDIEVVMTSEKTSDKPLVYNVLRKFLGDGLATLNGASWRRHRKAINPSLHLDLLRDFVDIFHAQGVALADTLGEFADRGDVVNVSPLCGDCANSAILNSVIGIDVDKNDAEKQRVVKLLPRGLYHFMYRLLRPWLLSDRVYSLLRTQYADYLQVVETITGFTKRVILQKKQALKDSSAVPQRKRQTFLDHVLVSEEGAVLSEEELVDEVRTILLTASGTSMDALSFIIYTLAIRQDVQDRVREEVDDILGEDRGRGVEHSDLTHLQYTERFIKETLRYFSIVPLFARKVTDDLTLPSGYPLPRGSIAAFWLPATHRNPKYFPEPDKFDPDRFLPENSRGRHPFAYVPFSAGPRNCIGQRYAMMFMKTVTATLVARLRFEIPDGGPQLLEDVPFVMNLTLSVRDGARVRVQRR